MKFKSIIPLIIVYLFSLDSYGKEVQSQEAVHLFTCAFKDASKLLDVVRSLEENGHFQLKEGVARSSHVYVFDGVCVKQVVAAFAQGSMFVSSQVCSDTELLQRHLERYFPDRASDKDLRSEQAFFMRKRGSSNFVALSKDAATFSPVSMSCSVELK